LSGSFTVNKSAILEYVAEIAARKRGHGASTMGDVHEDLRRMRLAELRVAHRDLDEIIERLLEGPYVDQLQVRRMKKRKLLIKDVITRLESALIPDLDA
jgi:hypothetical protein